MKSYFQLFSSFLMLSTLLIAGCSKDESTSDTEPEIITYSATYTISEISDDFFDLGAFFVTYADKDGKEQGMSIEKAQMPFIITVEDLKEDSKLSFDLIYGYFEDVKLTKEKYTFTKKVSLTVKGSDKSMKLSTLKGASLTMSKDNVKKYFDDVATQEEPFESTVKQFISKE